MPIIELQTEIKAPISRCFDLSRSIDLHKISTAHTNEEAISGTTSGLINLNESVTWRAVHLGITQILTTKITQYEWPRFFVDEMVSGAFKSFRHEHHFEPTQYGTLMTDHFEYVSPLGWLGQLADILFLKKYMANLLNQRNQTIKEFAESDKWKLVLAEV
jgi:ligand-binding SRPBCC domain-containing protein